jgi:hypothetical protein
MLKGKKTYLAVVAMVAFAVIGLALGKLDSTDAVTLMLQAAAIAGLRNSMPS